MLLIKPDTVLRWHRAEFRLLWRRKTRAPSNVPRLAPGVVNLITRLARENRLWGAELIRGELLKLAIRNHSPAHYRASTQGECNL